MFTPHYRLLNIMKYLKIFYIVMILLALGAMVSCESDKLVFEVTDANSMTIQVFRNKDVTDVYSYTYQVVDGNKSIIDQHVITSAPGAFEAGAIHFESISNNAGTLTAIVEKKNPHIVLAIHDSNINKSWPGGPEEPTRDGMYIRGQQLIQSLPPSKNGKTYVLGYEARAEDLQ